MDGTRIDKWLWAARFFKTRELASKACEMGRIESNGLRAKPAREVRAGDMLRIKNEAAEWEIEVLALSRQRGPPPLRRRCTARRRPASSFAARPPKSAGCWGRWMAHRRWEGRRNAIAG